MNPIVMSFDGQLNERETIRLGRQINAEALARIKAALMETFTGPARKPIVITTDEAGGKP